MSEGLVQKIQDLQVVCVRLFELLDNLQEHQEVGSRRLSVVPSDFDLVEVARTLLTRRRARLENLPAELFSEPGWDMLLDLFIVHVENRRVSVSSVCLATSVPSTTALRWLDLIEGMNLVVREASTQDRRVCYVGLSSLGKDALRRYLASMFDDSRSVAMVIVDNNASMLSDEVLALH